MNKNLEELFICITKFMNDTSILNDRESDIMTRVIKGEDIEEIAKSHNIGCARLTQILTKSCRTVEDEISTIKDALDEYEKAKDELSEARIFVRAMAREIIQQRNQVKELCYILSRKQQKRQEYKSNGALNTLRKSIFDCGFSVRVLNALHSLDIKQISDLVQFSRKELLCARNFSKKSLFEIDDFLKENGLAYEMDIHEIAMSEVETVIQETIERDITPIS